jgi:hypothetical protein
MMRRRRALIGLALAGIAAVPALATAAPKVTVTLSSGTVDVARDTLTLPLLAGRTADGRTTYYVVTDSSSAADAARRGVNYAPRLRNALGTKAVQMVTSGAGGTLTFPGTVDFSPAGKVVPGPTGFPPATAVPGANGDAAYSPLVATGNGVVLNAPQVANDTGQGGSVVSISPDHRRVTLRLLDGYFDGRRVLYTRLDASVTVVSALEASTYAPNLNALPGVGSNAASSARSAIIPVVNGARGKHNMTQSFPGAADYSPMWDVTPVVWTKTAIAAGRRHRITSAGQVEMLARGGELTSLGTGPANASVAGIRALGGVSTCTTVAIIG